MSDLNKAMIIGRLGNDPEIRYTGAGVTIATFSVATGDKWRDKQAGEMRERTEWHRVVVFGKLADICGEYLSKGAQVYVEGKIKTNKWEKDGVTRYTTQIECQSFQMLGSKSERRPVGASRNDGQSTGGYGGGKEQPKQYGDYKGGPSQPERGQQGIFDGEDIPF